MIRMGSGSIMLLENISTEYKFVQLQQAEDGNGELIFQVRVYDKSFGWIVGSGDTPYNALLTVKDKCLHAGSHKFFDLEWIER